MTGRTFYWMLVFEAFTSVEVEQREEPPINQAVAQRWNRSGTVNISPNQATEDVVKGIVAGCKEGGGIPADALLTNVVLLPNILIPR